MTEWTAPGTRPVTEDQHPRGGAGTRGEVDRGDRGAPHGPGAGTGGDGGRSAALQRELVRRQPLFPLRPMSVGELLSAATRIYSARPRLVLGLAAI
ncbi:MAG: glycerophosphodiester phosphodiesterase, partial [Brachybacterium sp.]|nr:glycerophosphodiester phosphodiesterase [Brachybacterium sp.]